jgi:hypothetical protein
MKQANPIAVRPRQGSKLEAVWNDNARSNKAMGEIIHSWASQFAEMAAASEQGEKTND